MWTPSSPPRTPRTRREDHTHHIPEERVPPHLARVCAVPSRTWDLVVWEPGWCGGACKALLPRHLCRYPPFGRFSITLQLCRRGVLPVGCFPVGTPQDSTRAAL